jgi:predicted PurR-regulated permease PerM
MTISMPHPDEHAVRSELLPAPDDTRPSAQGWSVTITPRTLWLAVGILALAAVVGIVALKGSHILILLFSAIVIAEGLRPIMNALHTRWHLPQPAAVLLTYVVILTVLCLITWLLIRALVSQISAFSTALPRLNNQVAHVLRDLERWLGGGPQVASVLRSVESQGGAVVQGALPALEKLPQTIGGLIFGAVVVAVMAFFWLTGIAALRPFVLSLLPAHDQPLVNDVLTDISRRLGGYLRGVVINMLVIGVLSTLGDWLLGAPFPILLGVVAGLTQVIPYFGPWISGAVVVIVVLPLAGPLKVVEVIGFYAILQTIVGNTLTPIIMMDTVDINPLLAIVAVLLGSALLGIPGAVLGVPAVAIVDVIVVRVLAPIARRASARVSPPARPLPARPLPARPLPPVQGGETP